MNFDSFTLCAATADLADAETQTASAHADAAEFRMDLTDDPLAALDDYDGDLPILATNRPEWEGGEAVDGPGRFRALKAATGVDAVEAVDVELDSVLDGDAEELLTVAEERDVAVVVSAHDFEATPPRPELVRTLTEAGKYGDVAKLAVTAETRADCIALLSATEQLTAHGDAVATMAMGEVGSHTRAVAPVYGSKIGYAPVDPADATAPGQYDLATLADLVDGLGVE